MTWRRFMVLLRNLSGASVLVVTSAADNTTTTKGEPTDMIREPKAVSAGLHSMFGV